MLQYGTGCNMFLVREGTRGVQKLRPDCIEIQNVIVKKTIFEWTLSVQSIGVLKVIFTWACIRCRRTVICWPGEQPELGSVWRTRWSNHNTFRSRPCRCKMKILEHAEYWLPQHSELPTKTALFGVTDTFEEQETGEAFLFGLFKNKVLCRSSR